MICCFDNGLSHRRRQAIISTNATPYESPGLLYTLVDNFVVVGILQIPDHNYFPKVDATSGGLSQMNRDKKICNILYLVSNSIDQF